MPLEIELLFTPLRTSTEAMRDVCVTACRDAGLEVARVATKPGGDVSPPAGVNLASTTLDVEVSVESPSSPQVRRMLERLSAALCQVRESLSDLPFGVTFGWPTLSNPSGCRSLAFRVWDPPDEIRKGFAALIARPLLLDGSADGWDGEKTTASVWGWERDSQRWLAV
jgi:hypothetical protein